MTRGICFKKLGITKSRYICIYGEEEEEAFPCLDYWDISFYTINSPPTQVNILDGNVITFIKKTRQYNAK